MNDEFVYLKPVEEKPVPRFGGQSYIGMKFQKDEKTGAAGYVVSAEVVRIPAIEFKRYRRAYQRALDDGAIETATKEEYDKHTEKKEKAAADDAKKRSEEASAAASSSEGSTEGDKSGKGGKK